MIHCMPNLPPYCPSVHLLKQNMAIGRPYVMLVLVTLFLATLSTVRADACPTPEYTVKPSGRGRRVWADKVTRIRLTIKNTSPFALDNYVIRMGVPTDHVTYQSYNVLGHTARRKAITNFLTKPDGSLEWTLFDMPAGKDFRFLIFVKIRDCASLGAISFPISSFYNRVNDTCPFDGPAAKMRIVMPKKTKGNRRPPMPTGCPTPAPTIAPSAAPSLAPI